MPTQKSFWLLAMSLTALACGGSALVADGTPSYLLATGELNPAFNADAYGAPAAAAEEPPTQSDPDASGCSGSATVNANMSTSQIQSVLNAHSGVICFSAGTYRLTAPLSPKSGQTLRGARGAVLSGATSLSTWSGSGRFTARHPTQGPDGVAKQWCEDLRAFPCAYPNDVFYDGKPLSRVTSPGAVGAGKFFAENGTIVIGASPHGHQVELGTTDTAIRIGASNVTVDGFTIEMFASDFNDGAIHISGGSGSTVKNCEIRYNHGGGVLDSAAHTTITGNNIHDNGQIGIYESHSSGVLVDRNDLVHNNIDGFWRIDGSSGGIKMFVAKQVTITNNRVLNNQSSGIWFDGNSSGGGLVASNLIDGNFSNGIRFEISYGVQILKNVVTNNALPSPSARGRNGCRSLACGNGIDINTAKDVEISGNVLVGNLNSIGLVQAGRHSNVGQPIPPLANVHVHGNTIKLSGGTVGLHHAGGPNPYGASNRFDTNTYHMNNLNDRVFEWSGGNTDKTGWQRAGQDRTPGAVYKSP